MRITSFFIRSLGLVLICLFTSSIFAEETASTEAGGTDSGQTAETEENESMLFDAEDDWLDITKFVDSAYGFVPMVIPITEPAIGYGAVALVAFLDKPDKLAEGETMRPNITAVGGMATENGTWGVFGADIRHWADGRIESLVAAGYMNMNLKYYPTDGPGSGDGESLDYNMVVPFGAIRGRYRFKGTPWSTALGYALAKNTLTISGDLLPPGAEAPEYSQRMAAFIPAITYDSRNNIFTPTKGLFAQVSAQFYSDAWGGEETYQIPAFLSFGFYPATEEITLGLKVGARTAHGDVPFYQLPFIQLRGVPALRYQGDSAGEVEAEIRWQCYKRFSVLGFGGHGTTRFDNGSETTTESATTYGLGFRYEIARGYGMHMGIDIARGPEDTIFYVQFGSAWFSP